MKRIMRLSIVGVFSISILACSFSDIFSIFGNGKEPLNKVENQDIPSSKTPAPPQVDTSGQPAEIIDICSLVEKADIESILAEPVADPKLMNGSCIFMNAKDSLYMVSIAIGQDDMAKGIMEGQAMMLGFAGAPLDDARMAELKSLSAAMNYKDILYELVASDEGSRSLKARLAENPKDDVVYWVWITAQSRRQAALIGVRGPSVVAINLIVSESQSEESMLAASMALADRILDRLPARFKVTVAEVTPESAGENANGLPAATPTLVVGSPTQVATPTYVGGAIPKTNPTPVGVLTPVGGSTPVGGPRRWVRPHQLAAQLLSADRHP